MTFQVDKAVSCFEATLSLTASTQVGIVYAISYPDTYITWADMSALVTCNSLEACVFEIEWSQSKDGGVYESLDTTIFTEYATEIKISSSDASKSGIYTLQYVASLRDFTAVLPVTQSNFVEVTITDNCKVSNGLIVSSSESLTAYLPYDFTTAFVEYSGNAFLSTNDVDCPIEYYSC